MADADWANYKRLRGQDLPQVLAWAGQTYVLAKIFKHDFYAATGLYQLPSADGVENSPRLVLKIYHTDSFWLLPLGWLGRWLCRREVALGQALQGIEGIPQFLGRLGEASFVREFVPGCNLRELGKEPGPDDNFFPRLTATLTAVHQRGIAHCDLSKPENVLVRTDGRPVLIDFQIAYRPRTRIPGLRWLSRRLLAVLQRADQYHLRKNHRRYRPSDFTEAEMEASRRKGFILIMHGWLRRPYRAVRHFLLRNFLMAKKEAVSTKS